MRSNADAGVVEPASASGIGRLDLVVATEAGEVAQRNAQRLAGVFVLIVYSRDALNCFATHFIHGVLSLLVR